MQRRIKNCDEQLAVEYLEKLLIDNDSAFFEIEGAHFTEKELIVEAIQSDPTLARIYNVLGVYIEETDEVVEIPHVGTFRSPQQAYLKAI